MNQTLTDSDVLRLFEESGALLTGHFILTSGKHSDCYLEKFDVLNQPRHVEAFCRELAARLAETRPDVVLGPTTLGIVMAYEVAKHLDVRAAYGEKGADGKRFLRRPLHIQPGQRVLVVDDVLTTGGSVRECITLVEEIGATLCGVGVLVDRSQGLLDFGVPLAGLLTMDVKAYDPDDVPEWLAAIPAKRPGSTGKK